MRLSALAAILALATQPAFATGMAETLVEPEVIAEEVRDASSGGFVLPLLLLALITLAASAGGGGDKVPPLDPGL